MTAYYNERDPYAAQWLRNLISAGNIAPGDVDERSILDVRPDDLAGYTQCHFFAGVGVWSYALRLAGWPDDKQVWTGSCPCQPFSVAGAGAGVADERHLWPHWFHLISQRSPSVVFGEQVEAAIKHGWLDLVQTDLEGIGYAVGAAGIPAAGVGAPHIRQRLWFVADSDLQREEAIRLADRLGEGLEGRNEGTMGGECETIERGCGSGGVEFPAGVRGGHPTEIGGLGSAKCAVQGQARREGDGEALGTSSTICATPAIGPTNGHWGGADWLCCRDGRWRPVEPGTSPLAHGAPARVGRLRAYGNAIVPQVAKEFIAAYMECN